MRKFDPKKSSATQAGKRESQVRKKNDFSSLVEKIHRLPLGETCRRKQRDKTSLSKRFEEGESNRARTERTKIELCSYSFQFLCSFCLFSQEVLFTFRREI